MCIIHRWKHIKGTFNKYFECKCGARKVTLGVGGYQPVDQHWIQARALLDL